MNEENKRKPITLEDVRRVEEWSEYLKAVTYIKKSHAILHTQEQEMQENGINFDMLANIATQRRKLNILWQEVREKMDSV